MSPRLEQAPQSLGEGSVVVGDGPLPSTERGTRDRILEAGRQVLWAMTQKLACFGSHRNTMRIKEKKVLLLVQVQKIKSGVGAGAAIVSTYCVPRPPGASRPQL